MSERFPAPAPVWWTSVAIAAQAVGVFVLPLAVALPTALWFRAREVGDTAGPMAIFTVALLGPVFVLQLLGLGLKSWRELRFWRSQRALGFARFLDVLHRHLAVVTPRGWTLLGSGVLVAVIALVAKWAEFGLLAVLALLLFYGVVGWTQFVSTFLVGRMERGLQRDRGRIARHLSPAVIQVGDRTEEVLTLSHVPVPWGYVLLVDDPNPPRLQTPSRYAVGSAASVGVLELRTRLRATPRGHWFTGPARIWYQDVFGITQVSVVSVATAELKVLPQIPPVQIVAPPRSKLEAPDVLTRPHRFATEDYFRFRAYVAGDDTRRIQWQLSLRAGQLHVRLPETKETSTQRIVLVLDAYLPPGRLLDAREGGEEILDALIGAWLGIGKELLARGERVSLVAATGGGDGQPPTIETIDGSRAPVARWQDLGARARWQGRYDLPELVAELGDGVHAVVVTARFTAAPPDALPGRSWTWLFLDPADALGPPEAHWINALVGTDTWAPFRWALRLPHPIGSEENSSWNQLRHAMALRRGAAARAALRRAAHTRAGATLRELTRRGDAIYRIERTPRSIRLVGLSGGTAAAGGTPAPEAR